jgi:hypothetical protein
MNWGHLTRVLLASPFYLPSDDLSTPEALVATSIAILDRMANSERLRHVSWTPERTLQRRATNLPPQARSLPKASPGLPKGDGGALVRLEPRPHTPRPGGAAERLPKHIEIVF